MYDDDDDEADMKEKTDGDVLFFEHILVDIMKWPLAALCMMVS